MEIVRGEKDKGIVTLRGKEHTATFKMVDETDFATPETDITVTAQISKDGESFDDCENNVSEIGNGWYSVVLTSEEMNAGEIILKCTGTGCAQCDRLIITT